MGKIRFSKIVLAGILYTLMAQIIHWLSAFASMKYYRIPEYFPVWSKLMMPTAGPPPASFMLYSLLFGLIGAMLISLVYAVIKEGVPGKTPIKKGSVYGLLLFLAAGLPGSFAMILLINLPLVLIIL